jgi:hypothetical protein
VHRLFEGAPGREGTQALFKVIEGMALVPSPGTPGEG